MKKMLILLALLTSCASKKTVQTEQRILHERIGAEWRDSMQITFHDVVIIDSMWGGGIPASARKQVKIKKIEMTRKSEAKSETEAELHTEAHSEQTPQASADAGWKWLIAIALAFAIWMNFSRLKKV